MDLDTKIEHLRTNFSQGSTTCLDDMDNKMQDIYASVIKEAERLNENLNMIKTPLATDIARMPKWKKVIKKIDTKLRDNMFYEHVVRRRLKKLYKGKLCKNVVYVKDLVCYEDIEFVMVCYKSILHRKPDKKDLDSSLYNLRFLDMSKIKYIHDLYWSPEGQKIRVEISGLKWKHRIYRLYMIGIKIPLLGNVIQFLSWRRQMNRRIAGLRAWNLELQKQIEEMVSESAK